MMRKRIISQESGEAHSETDSWVDLESLARVEITSEDPARPIESALVPGAGAGWMAAGPGEQRIRLLFDEPLRLRRVRLVFFELEVQRTQELALSWLRAGSTSWQPLVRQQFTFSPPGTVREVEDYSFEIDRVAALELVIVPEISGGTARASLSALQLA